jgi:hypothetical protein
LLPDKAATMFNFIKKAGTGVTSDKDEKEKRKRDKKDRKEKQKRERASMSAEELLRLDEVLFLFFFLWSVVCVGVPSATGQVPSLSYFTPDRRRTIANCRHCNN